MPELDQLKASLIAEIDDYITDFEKAGQVAIQFGKAQKQAGEEANRSSSSFDKTVTKLKSFALQGAAVTATLAGFKMAAGKAWDALEEGAALDLTARQFENVATAAGYSADVLLGKMRLATDGMVSDADLIKSGLDIIELGLADSEDGIVSLADAVATLGLDMQTVILTFSNNSKMRLDSLGLSVADVTRRAEELNATGFDGDAFDQAVLEGLTKRMETLGETVETTAGKMQVLETQLQNVMDAAKKDAVEIAGPYIESFVNRAMALNILKDAYDSGTISMADYTAWVVSVNNAETDLASVTEFVLGSQQDFSWELERAAGLQQIYGRSVENTTESTFYYQRAQQQANQAASAGVEAQQRIRAEMEATAGVADTLAGATANLDGAFADNTSMAQNMIKEWEWAQAGGQDLEDIITTIGGLQVEPDVKRELLEEALAAAVELDITLGNLSEQEGAGILKDALDLSSLEDAKALLSDGQSGILDDLKNLDGSIYKATVEFEDRTVEIRQALLETVAVWEGYHYATFVASYVQRGNPPGGGGGGGGGGGKEYEGSPGEGGFSARPYATGGDIHYHYHDNLALKMAREDRRRAQLARLEKVM